MLVAGCATRGGGFVPPTDLKGRDETEFAADVAECQAYARGAPDAATGAIAGALLGALLGAALAPAGHRNDLAGYGATMGALSGGTAAGGSQENIIRRCLVGRGWAVLG